MQRAASLVLGLVLLSVLLSPLQRELYIGDETKYGQVVREMSTGSFFLPTLEGNPFTHKPPLHFWLVSLLTRLFDLYSIWPFVLPSLISFGLLIWLMKAFEGMTAAFVCGTSVLIWGSAQTARMDVAFTALIALSAWLIWRAFEGEKTLIAAGAAAGAAFLFKGPMAPVIAMVLFGFEWWRRRSAGATAGPSRRSQLLALGVMLAIPLLWLVPAVIVGGEAFWREIFFKQTVGRAVGAWVHKSPPWFYLLRAPMTLAPWFLLAVVGIVAAWRRGDEKAKFGVMWMLAVLVPYTLLSSKLDVYMIAMLPAVALVVSRFIEADDELTDWGRRANLIVLLIFVLVGFTGLVLRPSDIREPSGILIDQSVVRGFFAVMLFAGLAGIAVTIRGRLLASTLALGLVPVVTFSYAAIYLVPLANEVASTRPLIRVLERQPLSPSEMALYASPHLWIREMNPAFGSVRHVNAENLRTWHPTLLVVRRKNAGEIAEHLRGYKRIDEIHMVGKLFDVYRK